MKILLIREYSSTKDTIGKLYFRDKYIHILEDAYNEAKVPGSTRIPAGQYKITPRKEGLFYDRYSKHADKWIAENIFKYGMAWIRDVPNYEYILIHPGTTAADTLGCLITGDIINNNSYEDAKIMNVSSTSAFKKVMAEIFKAWDKKEEVTITILDHDRDIKKMMANG